MSRRLQHQTEMRKFIPLMARNPGSHSNGLPILLIQFEQLQVAGR